MKHVFVINPTAGVKNSSDIIIEEVKKIPNLDYEIYLTKGKGDATLFVKEYISLHPNQEIRFFACGGDGTLFGVVNGCVGNNNVEVACVPIGSGNDFLKYYGDASLFRNIKNQTKGTAYDIDLIKINDYYTINVYNIGFDSKVVVKQAKIKKWPLMTGKAAYTFGVVFSLLGRMGFKCKLTIDDEVAYEGKMTLCAIANARCYGGGYYCCPKALVDDGLMDVLLVKKVSRITFANLVKDYKAGKHLDNPKIMKHLVYKQGKKAHLELIKPLPYSIDGEIEYNNNCLLEIVPKAVKFVLPYGMENKPINI